MTISEQLHKSKAHRDGFEPNCPKCLKDLGPRDAMEEIIRHLERCAAQNEADFKNAYPGDLDCIRASTAAAEQRRMIGILRLYQKVAGR